MVRAVRAIGAVFYRRSDKAVVSNSYKVYNTK